MAKAFHLIGGLGVNSLPFIYSLLCAEANPPRFRSQGLLKQEMSVCKVKRKTSNTAAHLNSRPSTNTLHLKLLADIFPETKGIKVSFGSNTANRKGRKAEATQRSLCAEYQWSVKTPALPSTHHFSRSSRFLCVLVSMLVYSCMCLCAYLCLQKHGDVRGQPWVLFLHWCFPVFRNRVSYWDLGLTGQAGVDGHGSPGVCLFLPHQYWDCKCVAPCVYSFLCGFGEQSSSPPAQGTSTSICSSV